MIINDKWIHCFAQSTVEFIFPGASDHCPALVQVFQPSFSPLKPFKVFNFWTKHNDFLSKVDGSWHEPIREISNGYFAKEIEEIKVMFKNLQ